MGGAKIRDVLAREHGFAIEAGFAGKESVAGFETACRRRGIELFALPPKSPICNGCVERANAAGRYELRQSCAGELSEGALNVELARFERFYNDCRPHQALGQTAPMQARIIKTSTKARWPPEKSHMY